MPQQRRGATIMTDPRQENRRILVVDDTLQTLELLQRNLQMQGYTAYTACGAVEAIRFLETTPVDLVITDMKMPQVSGADLVRHVRENYRHTEVMMITGYPTIEGAVEAIKHGAEEYLPKPFTDEELAAAVRRALEKLPQPGRDAGRTGRRLVGAFGLIGESRAMQKVYSAINKAAASSATVLITGESGSGKELVARAIHYAGGRASAPFVPVNCGGIPESLLESELFGHVKGAFTGAHESRAGFLQTADGGTIFLDEISETSLPMQVKLFRAIQEREFYMVGNTRPRRVDVRFVAATNKQLPTLVARGSFREELFYRINVITIELPPLRERGDDVLLLADHFARKFAAENGRPELRFTPKALRALKGYGWPGNVRELENAIHRAVVMCDAERMDVPDLPAFARFSALRSPSLERSLAEIEAEHIRNVLAHVNGNKSRAADMLGIDRKTLREKLRRYGIGAEQGDRR